MHKNIHLFGSKFDPFPDTLLYYRNLTKDDLVLQFLIKLKKNVLSLEFLLYDLLVTN